MKAYFVSNFTRYPKIILENNFIVTLFNNESDPDVLLNSINTVVKTYDIKEIIVSNKQSQELFEYLNSVYNFNKEKELKITLQEK